LASTIQNYSIQHRTIK
ncbi:unnamed protein product, partial [Rotaria sordida]